MADNTPNDIAEHFVELREFVGAGFARARTERRTELKSEISGLRTELKGEIAGIRTELKSEIVGVRGEVAAVREELGGEIVSLRSEMRSGFALVDERFDRLESKIDAFITVQSQINRELLDR